LERKDVVVGLAPGAELAEAVATTLARAGAEPGVVGTVPDCFLVAGEAWSRPVHAVDRDPAQGERSHAMVIDASGVSNVSELKAVYALLHPRIRRLRSCGRVVVLGRPPETRTSVAASAAQQALDGFSRSLARELGRKGSTANLVIVEQGAEGRLEPVLRFLLTARSAFVSGQVLRVSAKVRAAETKPVRPLGNRVIAVTGGAQGIGAATCRALAREGARVVVVDRPGEQTATQAVADAVGGYALALDVTERDAGERLVEFAAQHGGLHGVVHNAGVTRDKTLGGMSEDQWDLVLGVNLEAILRMNEAVVPALPQGGRLVLLSSTSGIAGNVGQTNYGASKAGIIGLVRALSLAVADRGIAVNAVAPGFIETRMTAAIPMATREVARRLSNLSQGGLPEDVAEAVTFLCSPGAHALSGQILRVCGGNLVGA
jgi:3-oxoacyl-[acyl-carrier protein] reductase